MRCLYCFLILLVSLALVVDVDAGWKFWKNKNKDEPGSPDDALSSSTQATSTSTTTTTTTTTTVAPTTASSSSWKFWKKKKDEASSTVAPSSTPRAMPTPRRGPSTPASANRGIAAAADPALAIGVGSVGGKIHEDARGQPRKPSPGTEVGLDIGLPKPARPGTGPGTATGYRDWAADFTGAIEPGRPSPKLPAQGPALTPGPTGNRPASLPGAPVTQQPSPAAGGRPSSVHGSPAAHQPTTAATPSGKPAVTQPTRPTAAATTSTTTTTTAKPAVMPGGTRTWADVAGGGSRSPSPTPVPRPGSAAPRPGQQPFEYPQPGNKPSQPTSRPGLSPGSAAAAAAATGGAVLAGGAAAGAAAAAANPSETSGYSSNPQFSKGKDVTDEDLEKLSEALFIKDTNNAYRYIKLNLQKQTSGGNPKDEAPEPLLEVKPEALKISTIARVLSIYDNYKLDTRVNEYISPAQRQEESLLVDTFLSTSVMSMAMRFLADKGFVKKDYYEYKDALRTLWFNLYSRGDGKIGSTGFEHVFLTELKLGTEVSGLHNWIYFNSEELKKRLDYLGYIKKVDLGNKAAIVKAHIKYDGIDKPVTNVFIGTSPELEMALYSVCFYARPEASCPVSLGGTKFNIITHKFKYRGREHIGSAYPEI